MNADTLRRWLDELAEADDELAPASLVAREMRDEHDSGLQRLDELREAIREEWLRALAREARAA